MPSAGRAARRPRDAPGTLDGGRCGRRAMSFIQGYDPETLREQVDPRRVRGAARGDRAQRSLPALLERVWLLKVLGRLDDALSLADESVRVRRAWPARARTCCARACCTRRSCSTAARTPPPSRSSRPAPTRPRARAGLSIAAFALPAPRQERLRRRRLRDGARRASSGAVPAPGVRCRRRRARDRAARDRGGRAAAHRAARRQLSRPRTAMSAAWPSLGAWRNLTVCASGARR